MVAFGGSTMHIRRATVKDYRELIAVDRLARSSRDRKLSLRRAIAEQAAYVLVQRDCLLAYAILRRSFFHRPFVEMLYVAETERRKGYGELLLARLEAKGLQHAEIWTSTNRSNKPMRRLLKKRGFMFTGRVCRLDKGDAELFYCKKRPNKINPPPPGPRLHAHARSDVYQP